MMPKYLWRVIWPEGEPHNAVTTSSSLGRFWHALLWSFRGKRTRSAYPIASHELAVPRIVATRCEKVTARGY